MRTTLLALLTIGLPSLAVAADAPSPEQVAFFEKKIRPVLVQHCYECHSGDKKIRGGLLLDSRDAMRRGGDSGPAVVPGDLDASLILEAIRYESFEMPPEGKLSAAIVADFEEWVRLGAIDPREAEAASTIATAPSKIDIAKGKEFWAFQPPLPHAPPPVQQQGWAQQPIDPFILKSLEDAGFAPAREADRATWLRRVTFDLIGLPPSPAEVEAFALDSTPQAAERVVDGLLASPHFGEKFARLWLDVSRYAEDQAHIVGNDTSLCFPNAYRYRNWVIRSLNDDMPYDEFIRRQLATDILHPDEIDSLDALGFIGLGPKYYSRGSLAVMADEWEDRVDTVGRGLLGLTVACARCHDHKFDPIPATDYHALAGVFASTQFYNRPLDSRVEQGKDGQAKKAETATHILREGQPTDLNVFIRGDVKSKGPVVPRHFLEVLTAGTPAPFKQGSGRAELAEAIVDRANPLTARVFVNRVWAQLFGRGLVGTPSNFGALGDRPTHPELLDDLAVRFMESGWSIKALVRELVLSAAYRQSSQGDAALIAADPENRLLGRMRRKRLSIEQYRDAVLAVSGRLDRTVGGRSIEPENPAERRRTVYSRISRLELNKLLQLFDYPDPNATSERRVETTTPLQKMFVMNNPFMVEQARALAALVMQSPEASANPSAPSEEAADRARIQIAYRRLFARDPLTPEIDLGLAFLHTNAGSPADRWQQYAQVLLASNEMLFID